MCTGSSWTECNLGDIGPGGGKVFYDAGFTQSWGRYLEAAPTDYQVNGVRTRVAWGCNEKLYGSTATAIGAGKANTYTILLSCTAAGIAARVAADYRGGGKSDWVLPSKDELNAMYGRRFASGFADDGYWSSSEGSNTPVANYANSAWLQEFGNGYQDYFSKTLTYYVRPVRAF